MQVTETPLNPKIRVVLNGGKADLDSATMPVRWGFSEDARKKNPTWLVFFWQNEHEMSSFSPDDYGTRYACRIDKGVHFIPLSSSGKHRLMVVAIASTMEEKAEKTVQRLLEHDGSRYNKSLSWQDAEKGEIRKYDERFVAATVVEFNVPENLFAGKPITGTEAFLWNWINHWYEKGPKNECQYRQRAIWALFLTPLTMVWRGFWALIYIPTASWLCWFFGYKPMPILKHMLEELRDGDGSPNVLMFSVYDVRNGQGRGRYKLFNSQHGGQTSAYHRFSPVELTSMAITPFLLYFIAKIPPTLLLFIAAPAILLAVAIALLVHNRKDVIEWCEVKIEESAKKEEEEHQALLEAQYSIENLPTTVVVSQAPMPPGLFRQFFQAVYRIFWSSKAKVCRPYAK